MALYDEELKKRYIINYEDIHYVKREAIYLIGISDEPSTDKEYFANHECLFYRILSTHQNVSIKLKTISKDVFSQNNK